MAKGNGRSSPRNRFVGAHHLKRTGSLIALLLIPIGLINASSADTYLQFERMWPTLQQPWYFQEPQGLEVDAAGNVYVADTRNQRVQVFTEDGVFIKQWTGFSWPQGVALDGDGSVFVADSNGIWFSRPDGSGGKLGTYGGSEIGQVNYPRDIAISNDGFIYIADTHNTRILKWTIGGVPVSSWNMPLGNQPTGIIVDDAGDVLVADRNRVTKFSPEGAPLSELEYPGISITTDSDECIYIETAAKWIKLDRAGQSVLFTSEEGGGYGIAVAEAGNVYVSDGASHVRKYSPTGALLSEWTSVGTAPGFYYQPLGIALDSHGNVFVADTRNRRIQKYSQNGVLMPFSVSNPEDPIKVAVDSADSLYVTYSDSANLTAPGRWSGYWIHNLLPGELPRAFVLTAAITSMLRTYWMRRSPNSTPPDRQ